MSSKVPYDLHPIEEERRDFRGAYNLQDDFNYIDKPCSSSAPEKIPETLDPGLLWFYFSIWLLIKFSQVYFPIVCYYVVNKFLIILTIFINNSIFILIIFVKNSNREQC